MDTDKFRQIKTTFPWRSEIVSTGVGGLIKIRDKDGKEVDLFTIIETIVFLSERMAIRKTDGENSKH